MQPGFLVVILALKPDIVFYLLNVFSNDVAINLVPGRPDNLSFPRCDLLRGSKVIIVIKIRLVVLNKTQRFKTVWLEQIQLFLVLPFFAE